MKPRRRANFGFEPLFSVPFCTLPSFVFQSGKHSRADYLKTRLLHFLKQITTEIRIEGAYRLPSGACAKSTPKSQILTLIAVQIWAQGRFVEDSSSALFDANHDRNPNRMSLSLTFGRLQKEHPKSRVLSPDCRALFGHPKAPENATMDPSTFGFRSWKAFRHSLSEQILFKFQSAKQH